MAEQKPKKRSKKDSLDVLEQQIIQAKLDGNTLLVKKIEVIIKAIKDKK